MKLERDAIVELTINAFNAFVDGTSFSAKWNKNEYPILEGIDGQYIIEDDDQ